MVTCIHCDTKNSIDSRYCKGCGKELQREAVEKAQASLEDLVSQGFRSLNDGQAEEATLIAEAVLQDDPNSTSALSLKAMCREREGQIAEALDLYERVLALKPDSALDRIKVTHLRNTLAGRFQTAPATPDRRTAIVGAIAATVLVIAVGVALAGFLNRGDDLSAKTGGDSSALRPVSPNSNPGAQNPNSAASNAQGGTQQGPPGQASSGDQGSGIGGTPNVIPSGGRPGPMPGAGEGWIPPAGVARPDGTATAPKPDSPPTKPPGPNKDPGPDPVTYGGGQTGGGGNTTAAPGPSSPGIVDIRLSHPGQPNLGGGANVPDEKSAEVLVRAGLQQYQIGRYQNAARSFENAIKSGADPARTNQRLGQCYEKLNRNAEAVTAYTRAAAAYDSLVKSGKGGSAAQSGLEACKAALQVLRGGSD